MVNDRAIIIGSKKLTVNNRPKSLCVENQELRNDKFIKSKAFARRTLHWNGRPVEEYKKELEGPLLLILIYVDAGGDTARNDHFCHVNQHRIIMSAQLNSCYSYCTIPLPV